MGPKVLVCESPGGKLLPTPLSINGSRQGQRKCRSCYPAVPGLGLYIRSLTKSFTRQYKTAMETKIDIRDDTFLFLPENTARSNMAGYR